MREKSCPTNVCLLLSICSDGRTDGRETEENHHGLVLLEGFSVDMCKNHGPGSYPTPPLPPKPPSTGDMDYLKDVFRKGVIRSLES